MKYNNIIICGLLLLSFSTFAENIEFNFQYYKNLLQSESARRHEIREENSGLFKKVVFNLDFNLLDSIFLNKGFLKIDFNEKDSINSNNNVKLDAISFATLQSLVTNYQEGNNCAVPKQYQEYVINILHSLIPEDICNEYGFQFIYFKDSRAGLGATIKYNGTIVIPLNTFGTPISNKENYLAFLIAHEVAHNLLYKSLNGKKKIEVECNRLACMLLKRAGYSLNVFQDYLDYCYLYQDLFAKGGDKRKYGLYNFYWDYSEDILKEFNLKEGSEFLVSETTFNAFREYSIKQSLINISSIDRFILEVNINHSVLNLVKNPNELIWQMVLLENLRRMILFEYVRPSWRAFAFKQDPYVLFSLAENVKREYHNNKIGLFGIIESLNNKDYDLIDTSLISLITYSDFFNYFLSKENNTTEFKNIKFLYEKSLIDSTNKRNTLNDTPPLRFLFVKSTSNKLKFIKTFNEGENITNQNYFISDLLLKHKIDESVYYGSTQILSLLNYGISDYSKIKYSGINTYNFLENLEYSKLNLKQITVWRIPSKLGVYGSGALAIINQSAFWLGIQLGFVILSYTPFTSEKEYYVDLENQTISKSRKTEIGNKTSQKNLQKIDTIDK